MSSLKLTMAASIYGNPYKLMRTLAVTPSSSSSSTCNSLSPSLLTISTKIDKISVRWTMTAPCAPLAHIKFIPHRKLGFRSCKSSSSSSFCSKPVSEDSNGESEASQSVLPEVVVDEKMRSEEKDDHQYHSQLQLNQSNKLLTLPTILTLIRVAAVPLLIGTFYLDSRWGTTATTSIFIAAAVTDWLDGYLARKMRLGTAFGAFLDPVADKLMVAATLILLCSRPMNVDMFREIPWLLTVPSIAIIGREITMSAVREWAASQNAKLLEAVAVNNLGKWKTASQMTALTILLATRDSSLAESGGLVASGVGLLYISAGLAVWSLVVYIRKIWKVLLK